MQAEREEKQLKEDNEFLMGKNKKLESKVANMESLNRAAPEEVQAEIEKLQAEAAQAKRRYNMDLEDTRKEVPHRPCPTGFAGSPGICIHLGAGKAVRETWGFGLHRR